MQRQPVRNRCARAACSMLLVLLALLAAVGAWQPNKQYYGAGRRIAMSSVRTLTFYSGERTAYRRTEALPQLNCVGALCSRYQPDVVQCQAMGDAQWKCSADLPSTMRLGRVEVSCEGYDYAQDPYILKDSCALTYHLLPAKTGPDDPWRSYRTGSSASSIADTAFKFVFWGIFAVIVYGFVRSIFGRQDTNGARGRGGGGGGGGWWPGGFYPGNPPPPYTPKPEDPTASSSSSSSWRPGFWTGLGLGGLAASAAASAHRRQPNYPPPPTFFDETPFGRGYPMAGPSTNRRGWESRTDAPGDWHESTGFGGTRNR